MVKALPHKINMQYNDKNFVSVMVYICETFGLNHQQMMDLRGQVEKAFHSQPIAYSKKSKAPVSLNAVAIVYGLLIGFGGQAQAFTVSKERVIQLARAYDPYGEMDRTSLIAMFAQARKTKLTKR